MNIILTTAIGSTLLLGIIALAAIRQAWRYANELDKAHDNLAKAAQALAEAIETAEAQQEAICALTRANLVLTVQARHSGALRMANACQGLGEWQQARSVN